ncbi:MAG: hypothetical protein BWK79_17145 [Beggiatoa sp. IS2]|nr:MAG: hypothetical protein BWK79_17145 [Beggiatoa sp. IS2]
MCNITVKNNLIALVKNNDGKEASIPIRHGDTTIPEKLAKSIRGQGKDPANYFCVANQYVMELGFLQEWTEMVNSVIAKRKAESAAKLAAEQKIIETTARPVLALWDSNLRKVSVLYVNGSKPVGDWSHISGSVATRFITDHRSGQKFDGTLTIGMESGFFYITQQEFDVLIAQTKIEELVGELAAETAKFEAKVEAQKQEAQKQIETRIAEATAKAEATGLPVEIARYTVPCDGSACECSFDLVADFVRGNGEQFKTRTHCH